MDKLVMHGRITIENSGDMRRALARALRAKPTALTVDLSDAAYIDTSGLATLVEAARIARGQGTRLVLKGLKDQPRYLFEITNLERFFDMAVTEASA